MAALRVDFQVLGQVLGLRQQLQSLKSRAAGNRLAEAIATLESELQDLAGRDEGATFLSTPQGRSLARLNIGLSTLLVSVDSADAPPTTQQSGMFKDLKSALDQQLAKWEELKKTDVSALNSQLKPSGLALLNAASAAVIEKIWESREKVAGED
jgi:hypothetical protein